MVALSDGVSLVQQGIDGTGDCLAVGDVHAALLVQVQPQETLVALADVLHIPKLAAVGFHDGLGDLGNDVGYFHQTHLTNVTRKRGARPSLLKSSIVRCHYITAPRLLQVLFERILYKFLLPMGCFLCMFSVICNISALCVPLHGRGNWSVPSAGRAAAPATAPAPCHTTGTSDRRYPAAEASAGSA